MAACPPTRLQKIDQKMSDNPPEDSASPGEPQPPREVIVTCSDDEGSVERVAEVLRDRGFEVESVLRFAGSVVGRWAETLEALREIPGVTAVEESEEKFPQQ